MAFIDLSSAPYIAVALLFIVGPYLFATIFLQPAPPMIPHSSKIMLLIAHPDDESMFFAPTVLALTQKHLGNHLKILCLSSGNSEGMGPIRKRELVSAAQILGIERAEDVLVMDDDRFLDGMLEDWNVEAIAGFLEEILLPKQTLTERLRKGAEAAQNAPKSNIDVLVTFDAKGVSNHPNHRALYHGSLLFAKNLKERYPGYRTPIKIFTLTSVNVLRKYLGVVDIVPTIMSSGLRGAFKVASRGTRGPRSGSESGRTMIVVSGPANYRSAQNAMRYAHVSQMRWFRWGWIGLSRYMMINDLQHEGPI